MACTAKQYADTLQGWVGRNEKDGTHKMIIDLYNSHIPRARGYKVTYKDAWCASTMGAAAVKCNATDICPMECSCGEIINLAKNAGIWIENDDIVPEIGDWVVYDWDDDKKTFRVTDNKGYPEHVGGVVSVDFAAGTFKVVEGNFSDAVKIRTLEINGLYIRGFVRPRYTAEPVVAPAPVTPAPAPSTSGVIGTAVAKTSMKVRDAATTSNTKVVGYISSGQTVEVLEVLSNGWYKIKWKDGFAYTSNAGNKYYTYTAKAVATPAPAPAAPAPTPAPAPAPSKYYAKYTGSSYHINEVFAAIGVPEEYRGKWNTRIPVAKANGITNYTGSYEQNTKLMNLAKAGKLVKA